MELQSLNSTTVMPMRPMLTAPTKLFAQALEFHKTHFKTIALLFIAPFIAVTLQVAAKGVSGLGTLFGFVYFVVNLFATIALLKMITRNGILNGTLSQTYSQAASLIIPFLWVSILGGLPVMGGFVLLIIPGIYVSVMLAFSTYIFIAEDRRGMAALIQSWNYVKGYWWAVFGRMAFLVVLIIIASLIAKIFAVGTIGMIINEAFNLFILVPFSMIYSYFLYDSVKLAKAGVPGEDTTKVKKILTVLAVLGILGYIGIGIAVSVGAFALKNNPQWIDMRHTLPAASISPVINFVN